MKKSIFISACQYYVDKFQKLSLPDNPKLIVIDVETTGLNPQKDEILQLSIIDENSKTLYNQYFKPTKTDNWREAQAVNGISPDMVKNCPSIEQERKKIQTIIDLADIIVGYNIDFDMNFLFFSEIFSSARRIVDIMEEFSKIYGEWSDYFGDYKWQKLSVCAEYYHYDWGFCKPHDSLADCRATLHCYKEMQKKGEILCR